MWNEYCDWYVECSKVLLNPSANGHQDPNLAQALALETRRTLLSVFEEALRVMHPFMPYMTEALWQTVSPLCNPKMAAQQPHTNANIHTIMLQAYPVPLLERVDQEAITAINWFKTLILSIRNIRGETQIPPGKKITLLLSQGSDLDKHRIQQFEALICSLAKVESMTWVTAETMDKTQAYATALVQDLSLFIPLAGLVDQSAEEERRAKHLQKLKADHEKLLQKLANQGFVDRAPPAIVAAEQARLEALQKAMEKLQ